MIIILTKAIKVSVAINYVPIENDGRSKKKGNDQK
jgi:hypothetical protein